MRTITEIKNDVEKSLQLEDDCLIDNIIDCITCTAGYTALNERQGNALMMYVTMLEKEIVKGVQYEQDVKNSVMFFLLSVKDDLRGVASISSLN